MLAKEEDFCQALYTQSQAQFDDHVSTGVVLNNVSWHYLKLS
jgi:hypothetical protein